MKERLQAWGNAKVIEIASCIIFNDDHELLLLQRHSDDLGGGQWGTPGGRLEPGEDAKTAIVREVFEETSLTLEPVNELGTHEIAMPFGTVRMTSFKAHVPNGVQIITDPDEHHGFTWLPLAELLTKENILWGVPTVLNDFALLDDFEQDPTLLDGTKVRLIALATGVPKAGQTADAA